MIDPQTYTASTPNAGEARTAGHMPEIGGKKAAEAGNFQKLVQRAGGEGGPSDPANTAQPAQAHHGGFFNFLMTLFDIINPLEHIPVVSTIYENVTGHHMNPVARIAGDTLYGGPVGAAVGVANVISEKQTGKDIGENMVAMLSGHKDQDKQQQTMLAQDGAPKASDIIWNDAPAAPASTQLARNDAVPATGSRHFPGLPSPSGKAVKSLADYMPQARLTKDGSSAAGDAPGGAESRTPPDSTPGLQSQEAPADASAPQAVPPELIASRMMQGLDKYAALKKAEWSPAPTYTAAF